MMKIFTHFKNEKVKHSVSKFIAEHRDEVINKEYDVVYVDDYEDAEYGTVYAVTNFELELIGVFAKHEPLTYREVIEGIYEDVGEQKDVVLFDITEYTGADYNMPEYFKGYEGETDAFLEESVRDEDLPTPPFSTYLQFHKRNVLDELAESNRKVEEKVDREECESISDEYEEDIVNKPSHYTFSDKFEIIDVVEEITSQYPPELAFAIGNAVKYISRAPHKNGKQDIEKSLWYIQRVLDKWDKAHNINERD